MSVGVLAGLSGGGGCGRLCGVGGVVAGGGPGGGGAPPGPPCAGTGSPSRESERRLCSWTCSPAAIACVAIPIGCPYLRTCWPAAMSLSASLWPWGTVSRTVTWRPAPS